MEHFSPVINDVTFRIVLTRMILEGLDAKVVDINNAFLIGDLDHEIFMKVQEGYKECNQDYEDGKALKLDKAIYGLVQAARQFWNKFSIVDVPLVKSVDGLSVMGLQGLHCILTQ